MADETDYIAGYDPFVISAELRNKKTDADLDAYYKAATGGGVAARGRSFFGFPTERLVVNRPNPDKYAMGLKSRRADFERDTANYKQDSAQLQALIAAEKQRRASEASAERGEDYYDFYLASSPKIDAAIATNQKAQEEYNKKPYGFFGAVREAFTGERAALDREYAANYERQRQLGDLKSKLYAADKTGGDLPQELLDQYQSVGGEPYQRKFSSKKPAPAEPADEPAPTPSPEVTSKTTTMRPSTKTYAPTYTSDPRKQRMAEEMSYVPRGQMANAEDILLGSAAAAKARRQRMEEEMSDVPSGEMANAEDILFGNAAVSDARRKRMAEEMSDVPSGEMVNAEDILLGSAAAAKARRQRMAEEMSDVPVGKMANAEDILLGSAAAAKAREPINYSDAVDQRLEELMVSDVPSGQMANAQDMLMGAAAASDARRKRTAEEMSDVPSGQMANAEDMLMGAAAVSDARRQRMAEEMSSVPSGQMANAEDILRGSADTAESRDQRLNEFKKIMGSSFNPKSSADAQKMDVLLQFKQQYPELSTNALALKIYRSGAL
jgi:hypothetical protein